MSTFQKKTLYFQLKHTQLDFFAQINANQQNDFLTFNTQKNNIRIKPLNLKKNVIISNIFIKQQNSGIKTISKNLIIYNLCVLFLLNTITKKDNLIAFLNKYFMVSQDTLAILCNFYLNNTFLSYDFQKKEPDFNWFLLNKANEICFYQYHNTLLNEQKINKLTIKEFLLTNYWINISLPRNNTKNVLANKIIHNYLINRNLNTTRSNINIPGKIFNLNTNANLLIKNSLNYYLYKPFDNYLNLPKNFVYALTRLEEKIQAVQKAQDTNNTKKLVNFYNFLIELSVKHTNKTITTNYLLGNIDTITKAKNIDLDFFINKAIKNSITLTRQHTKVEKFFSQLKNQLSNKNMFKQTFTKIKINKYQHFMRLKVSKSFNNKKLELTTQYTKTHYNNKIISTLLQQNTKIFYINALALTKFGFLLEKKNTTNPNKFLATLDREMISKYKYIGVYIKDLIRVAFIALFLKKPAFLAKFIAFQLNVLPKNRKETIFIRFIIKLVKTFAAEREEIWGLRLKFKGRVNRWRRTKVILGQRGILPLHTMQNRIEYGSAQGVNRKGALGVHIWIWYNPIFKNLLKNTYQKYFIYSKYLNYKKQIND